MKFKQQQAITNNDSKKENPVCDLFAQRILKKFQIYIFINNIFQGRPWALGRKLNKDSKNFFLGSIFARKHLSFYILG